MKMDGKKNKKRNKIKGEKNERKNSSDWLG